jgi:diguanylate cyclase (GGDEF)-like protein
MRELPAAARPLVVPASIAALATLAVWIGPPLPQSLAGLRTLGPYAVLLVALAMAWRFNRGRAFMVAASLAGAFAVWQHWPQPGVHAALILLVPLNVFAAMVLPELGARYRAAYLWLAVFAAEAALVFWLQDFPSKAAAMPLAGRLAFAAAFAAAVWRAWPELTALQVGNAAALAAFFVAATWVDSPGAYSAFMSAGGMILILALFEESHRLAFRDPLTGLPGRRALEERMRGLGSRFAIAMVDVDHFKKFNDTHGHDIGDQVLKLVGARLAEVGGGGIAFRYGGEEFSVLFPGAGLDEALPHLEAIRASVESYRMAVRAPGRPKTEKEGAKRRAHSIPPDPEKHLSVTVSIGACAPGSRLRTPAQVIRAADEALYRAKQGGRNRVST